MSDIDWDKLKAGPGVNLKDKLILASLREISRLIYTGEPQTEFLDQIIDKLQDNIYGNV